jgi:hypothetical protein
MTFSNAESRGLLIHYVPANYLNYINNVQHKISPRRCKPFSYSPHRAALLTLLLPLALLLLQPVRHRPLYPLLQTHNRAVPQPPLRFRAIVIPCHTTKPHNPPLERRILAHQPGPPLHNRRQHESHIFADDPHMLGALLIARRFPHRACEIPEIHWLVVRDDERFTVYFLVVQGGDGGLRGYEERVGGE